MASNESGVFIQDGIAAFFAVAESPDQAAERAFLDMASDVLSYAKDNAPWEDQTGDARNGLEVEVTLSGGDVTMELYHTVDYGLWLEVIQNGRFATIMPTLEVMAPEVFARAGGIVTGGGG